MRLDKFLSVSGVCTRSEAKRAVRIGAVSVNGAAVRSTDVSIDPNADKVTFYGKHILYNEYVYIMLNKPQGYVSATEDGREKTVLDLLPKEALRPGLFPCGRLDKNTLGLMLITDDGELAHRLLAPKTHVSKVYRFCSRDPISQKDADRFEQGVTLEDGYVTLPAKIELDTDMSGGYITLHEGKYHQIKRMLEALDNKITYLERVSFGCLMLDETLERGQWRYLTDAELEGLKAAAKQVR